MRTMNFLGKIAKEKTKRSGKKALFLFAEMLATGCFVGKIKYASGTFGSLLAILLCIPFVKLSLFWQVFILGFLLTCGTYATYLYLIKLGDLKKDPKEVVIDEIFAVFLTTFLCQFITPKFEWQHCLSIFALFRTFDIIKPYPISFVDKNIHGAKGIMLDDILAGLASFLVFVVVYV